MRRVRILRRGSRSTCVHRRDVNLILILRPASVRVERAHGLRRARACKRKHMHVTYTHAYVARVYIAWHVHPLQRQSEIGQAATVKEIGRGFLEEGSLNENERIHAILQTRA